MSVDRLGPLSVALGLRAVQAARVSGRRQLARDTDTTLVLTDRRAVRSEPVALGEHRTDNALLDAADVHVQVHSYLVGAWSVTVVGRGLAGWSGRARAATAEHWPARRGRNRAVVGPGAGLQSLGWRKFAPLR